MTKDEAGQILVLASEYANLQVLLQNAYDHGDWDNLTKLKKRSNDKWLKLKALVLWLAEE